MLRSVPFLVLLAVALCQTEVKVGLQIVLLTCDQCKTLCNITIVIGEATPILNRKGCVPFTGFMVWGVYAIQSHDGTAEALEM